MPTVFISHSPSDSGFARRIAQVLVDAGSDVWLNTPDLPSGRWHNDLAQGFELCDAMVVVLSRASVAERRVIDDWNAYFERRKPVVLTTEEEEDGLGIQLERGQYVDFYAQPFEAASRQLLDTLRFYNVLPQAAVSPPPVLTSAINEGATIRSTPVDVPQARTGTPIFGPRRDPALTQPAVAQETSISVEERRRPAWVVPAAIGGLLALLVIGGLVYWLLVLSPANERANQEATSIAMSTLNAEYLALTADAVAEQAAGTRAAEAALLALTESAPPSAESLATATAQAAAAEATRRAQDAVLNATQQAEFVVVAVTQTAESFLASAAELGSLQGTLSAQQVADRGVNAPAPTTHRFANQSLIFNLQREWFIGAYVVRLWQDPTAVYQSLTIDRAGQQRIQLDSMMGGRVDDLTGTDISGNGSPDVIYEIAFAGAEPRCSVIVYDLGTQTATRIAETPTGMCGARFADLNNDGVRELIVNDPTYIGQFCSPAESPLVEVVLAYSPTQRRFIPQSARFDAYYTTQAQNILARADLGAQVSAQAAAGELDSAKCSVLNIVLPYLYGGRIDQAWATLRRYYTYADAATFQSRVNTLFTTSPFCK